VGDGTGVNRLTALASENAPFVFFDGVLTHAVTNGVIQIELAAKIILPDGKGGALSEVVVTGRVRCSAAAAANLRRALDSALLIAARPVAKRVKKKIPPVETGAPPSLN
jgi:hypothetical protein